MSFELGLLLSFLAFGLGFVVLLVILFVGLLVLIEKIGILDHVEKSCEEENELKNKQGNISTELSESISKNDNSSCNCDNKKETTNVK